MTLRLHSISIGFCALLLTACAVNVDKAPPVQTPVLEPSPVAVHKQDDVYQDEPEGPTGFGILPKNRLAFASNAMVVAGNPFASQAGLEILARGGSAIDAAIAVQMVLTLVEPQSSGIGGGAYMVYWDKKTDRVEAYDGRETAPLAANKEYFYHADGTRMTREEAGISGRAVGVPGSIRMLEEAHKRHGRLPWEALLQPAIRLAENGFQVSPRLNGLLKRIISVQEDPTAFAYFFDDQAMPRAVGETLKNPRLATTLRLIAEEGADAFYTGPLAASIVEAVKGHPERPGLMSLADLAGYRAKVKEPLCTLYRKHKVCGVGPSTSGGATVAMMLGILDRFDMPRINPRDSLAMHLFFEAARLAYADRNVYLADDTFVDVPMNQLMSVKYLNDRQALIDQGKAMTSVSPGNPRREASPPKPVPSTPEPPSTTHFSIVDAEGNALSLTSTVGWGFGSGIMVEGFLLNNQLIAFDRHKADAGQRAVNGVEGGKRPRSSLAPTLVFNPDGSLRLVIGSPGGRRIPAYVVRVIMNVIDWNLDVQTAISLPNMAVGISSAELESNTPIAAFTPSLRRRGHRVKVRTLTSGLHGIEVRDNQYLGGADPRREGRVAGW